MSDGFYRAFEDKFRGPRDLIKSRLKAYLPFILPLLQLYPKAALVDLGCGRGEWLELTTEYGFQAQGVDIDEGMLQNSRDLGLVVQNMDALALLQELPDNSQSIVSGFHIAEHIAFEQLQRLVQQAKRVLVPGGLLILETPNPENLITGTSSFYLDPTHQRPIPPELLHFLPEHYGYARQKIIRLQEPPHLANSLNISLLDVMAGVSTDYSVIAQTNAPAQVLHAFDQPFSQNYGLNLHTLAARFQQNMSNQLELAESVAQAQLQQALQVAQTAQEQMQHALANAEQADSLANVLLQEKQSIAAELTAVQQELHNIHQANSDHWLQLERTHRDFDDLQKTSHHHLQLAEERMVRINALFSSVSWRITAPLKWLAKPILGPSTTTLVSPNQTQVGTNFNILKVDTEKFHIRPLQIDKNNSIKRLPVIAMKIWSSLENKPKIRENLLRLLRISPVLDYKVRRMYEQSILKNQQPASDWRPAEQIDNTTTKESIKVKEINLLSAKSKISVLPVNALEVLRDGINAGQRSPLEVHNLDYELKP